MRALLMPLILLTLGLAEPSPGQISGTMELSLVRDGAQWKVEAKFDAVEGRVSSSPKDLRTRENEIEFTTTMLEAELRFSGKVTDDNMTGTIADFQAGDVLPPGRKPTSPDEPGPDHTQVPAGGRAQGVALSFGKRRIVILGEAAMLTAQVAQRGFRFGMNLPGIDNRKWRLT